MTLMLDNKAKTPDKVVSVCHSTELVGIITSKGRHGRIATNSLSASNDQLSRLNLKSEEQLTELVPLIS